MTNKRYKVWLIKEYVVTADSKEEAIEKIKMKYLKKKNLNQAHNYLLK